MNLSAIFILVAAKAQPNDHSWASELIIGEESLVNILRRKNKQAIIFHLFLFGLPSLALFFCADQMERQAVAKK